MIQNFNNLGPFKDKIFKGIVPPCEDLGSFVKLCLYLKLLPNSYQIYGHKQSPFAIRLAYSCKNI